MCEIAYLFGLYTLTLLEAKRSLDFGFENGFFFFFFALFFNNVCVCGRSPGSWLFGYLLIIYIKDYLLSRLSACVFPEVVV